MKQGELVHFNYDNGQFYRVGKENGIMKPSYVNGQLLPSFKPGITGITYQERKKLSPQRPHKEPKLTFHERTSMNYQTFGHESRSNFFQTIIIDKGYKRPTLTFHQQLVEPHSPREKKFQITSRQFEELMNIKKSQNHSPKKDIAGNVPWKKLTDERCLTKVNLPNISMEKSYIQEKKKIKKKCTLKVQEIPKQCEENEQIKRERSILYKFQPDLLLKENERSLEKQKEKRKNMLILEKLAISTMNKRTKNMII